jgi:citrate/tricarballylate utilization protein
LALKASLLQAPLVGDFYAIFGHNLLVSLFAPVFLFAVLALGLGVRRFWRDVAPGTAAALAATEITGEAAIEATVNALRLKYLDGGHGEGCNNEDDGWTLWRRRFHHLTFYGFLLCFAATAVATLYHYLLGWDAPYDWPSLPKLLGVLGGISLLAGTAGLFSLNLKRHPLHGNAAQKPMDRGFMALLFFSSLSGLALWLGRGTTILPALLAVHLGVVMALFATLPYGKFAHGIFRGAALLKWAIEKRQPDRLKLGSD